MYFFVTGYSSYKASTFFGIGKLALIGFGLGYSFALVYPLVFSGDQNAVCEISLSTGASGLIDHVCSCHISIGV